MITAKEMFSELTQISYSWDGEHIIFFKEELEYFLEKLEEKLKSEEKEKMSLTLETLQFQQAEWSKRNFPNEKPHQCLLGIMEEVGELTHAHLKLEQGIRTNEDHEAMKKDAVGDIVIYLAGYCSCNNLNFEECVWQAWNEVKKRDWTKENQKTGASNETKEWINATTTRG